MSDSYSKWKSRRWIVTLWSMILITIIVILGIIFKNDSYAGIATALVTVPVSFTSLETLKKWKTKENENDNSEIINEE